MECGIIFNPLYISSYANPQPGDYPLAIALVAQGKINLKPLVTHRFGCHSSIIHLLTICRFPFDQAITAFKATRSGKGEDGKGVIKVIISGPDVSIDED